MKKTLVVLAGVCVFCVASISFAVEGNDDELFGVWDIETAEVNGDSIDRFDGATLTLGKTLAIMVSYFSSGRIDVDENPYEVDTSVSPKRLTLYQREQREDGIQCSVYEVKDGRLTICMRRPSAEKKYPQSIDEANCLVLTLKRREKE